MSPSAASFPRAPPVAWIPVVAIGGITPENGAALIEAGADMLAVIEGVFAQPDIRAAALAHGLEPVNAVAQALSYTWHTLKHGYRVGMGQLIPDRFYGTRTPTDER